jgi:hypothetical protein
MDTVLEEETIVETIMEEVEVIRPLNELLDENSQNPKTLDVVVDKEGERTQGSQMVLYTPELAKYILKHHNNNNRPLNRKNVDHILNEMNNGNWVSNGDTTGFDVNDDTTNGQHRLTAISEGTKSYHILTVTGLDPKEALKTIDTGFGRSSSDVLAIEGIENSSSVSPMVRFINDIVNNCWNNTAKGRTHTLSNTDVLNYYHMLGEEKVADTINWFKETKDSSLGLQQKVVNGFYYVLTTVDSEKGLEFMNKLMTGNDLTDKCPIKLLRAKLIKAKITNSKGKKLNPTEKIKYLDYTWNLFIEGREMINLNLPKDYKIKTDFSSVQKIR